MKKLKFAVNKSLFGQIATCTCLAGASAGIVFGVSAGTFKIQYLELDNPQARLKAALEHSCYSQDIVSQWNMYQKGNEGEKGYIKGVIQPETSTVTDDWWDTVHHGTTRWDRLRTGYSDPSKMDINVPSGTAISAEAEAQRKNYSALVIDGATHTAMDRSFNQGLYNGLVNFNKNIKQDVQEDKDALVFKPSQDSTQEFINIYRAVAAKTRVLSLAGFNHVTPINALGKQLESGLYEFSDNNIANTGMMLMDGDVTNNQNVASVLFRADEPAFLTALATCMYFYNNIDLYHANYQDMSVATYGGTAIPTVVLYMGGFQRGIEFFNRMILKNQLLNYGASTYMKNASSPKERYTYFVEQLLPSSKYREEVEAIRAKQGEKAQEVSDMLIKLYDEFSIKMIKLGEFGTHFSGSFTSGDAIGISKQLLNRGASAIIAIAGPQSLDTAQEIMNQNSKCIVIGVDSAMERSDYQKPFTNKAYADKSTAPDGTQSAQINNIIKFSAVKDMTNVSDKMLRLAATGKHWDVDNERPWTSVSSIPSYTEDEVFQLSLLNFDFNDTAKTYDVKGFKDGSKVERHVLRIPLTQEHNGVTYKLRGISGFNTSSGATNLVNVDTLCFSGEKDDTQEIVFGTEDQSAFDYSDWSGHGLRPGIKYIDFRNINADQISLAVPTHEVFHKMITESEPEKCSVYKKGIIKFDSLDKETKKQDIFQKYLFSNDGSLCSNWAIAEPDPYKSICSFGFKTCGNVENGLISISWDGWPLLFQALCFIEGPDSAGTSFFASWINHGSDYCRHHTVDEKFKEMFDSATQKTAKDFITYDTKSVLNENYSDLMSVLGYVLRNQEITVPKDMTVLLDKNGTPYLPEEDVPMSVLDWLKYNMYFTV